MDAVNTLIKFHNLKWLNFGDCRNSMTNTEFELLIDFCPNLIMLHLAYHNLLTGCDSLYKLTKCANLKFLNIWDCSFSIGHMIFAVFSFKELYLCSRKLVEFCDDEQNFSWIMQHYPGIKVAEALYLDGFDIHVKVMLGRNFQIMKFGTLKNTNQRLY